MGFTGLWCSRRNRNHCEVRKTKFFFKMIIIEIDKSLEGKVCLLQERHKLGLKILSLGFFILTRMNFFTSTKMKWRIEIINNLNNLGNIFKLFSIVLLKILTLTRAQQQYFSSVYRRKNLLMPLSWMMKFYPKVQIIPTKNCLSHHFIKELFSRWDNFFCSYY